MSLKFRFWLITCAAVIGFAVTAGLGRWQLGRAAQKEALQAVIERQSALPVMDASTLLAASDVLGSVHRKAVLRGRWLPQHTVFLDNRQMDGKPGFFVMTPFELADQNAARHQVVLVQRGWLARNFLDRNLVPAVPTPAGVVQIEGRMAPPPSKLYAFKGVDAGRIRQNIDLPEFAQEIQRDLLPVSFLQTDEASGPQGSDGLLRRWPKPNFGVETHYGYMAQWWALSALIFILYVWFQLVRPQRTQTHATH